MIQKQGTWISYDLKPRDVKRRFFACKLLLQRQKRKGFLHRILTADEIWIHYSNPKRRKSWGLPGHASTSSARPNILATKVMLCIWWDQVGLIYYDLFKTERNHHWGTVSNAIDAYEPSTARKTARIRAEAQKSDSTA